MLKAMTLPTTVRARIRPSNMIKPLVKREARLEGTLPWGVGVANKGI